MSSTRILHGYRCLASSIWPVIRRCDMSWSLVATHRCTARKILFTHLPHRSARTTDLRPAQFCWSCYISLPSYSQNHPSWCRPSKASSGVLLCSTISLILNYRREKTTRVFGRAQFSTAQSKQSQTSRPIRSFSSGKRDTDHHGWPVLLSHLNNQLIPAILA